MYKISRNIFNLPEPSKLVAESVGVLASCRKLFDKFSILLKISPKVLISGE